MKKRITSCQFPSNECEKSPMIAQLKELINDTIDATSQLFKVMIPVIVGVKLLQEMGLIAYVAMPLEPVMRLVGLPAEMGLVWASAILNNIYTAIIVLVSLGGESMLTQAQATVLGVLVLVVHALPVESAIARKSGAHFLFQCAIRILGGLTLAWLLNTIYLTTDTLQQPVTFLFSSDQFANQDIPLWQWGLDQVVNLASIFGIILVLLAIMRVLDTLGVIRLLNAALRPPLKLIGIGPKAATVTVIGLTMGIGYGGGLIIAEANSGNVNKEDIFYSLTLMGLCHSIIEDTLLVMLIGAHLSGILWARMAFAVITVAIIVQIVRRVPERIQNRFLWVNR